MRISVGVKHFHKVNFLFFSICTVLGITGCAPGYIEYTPPQNPPTIETRYLVTGSPSVVWNRLTDSIKSRSLMISNANKNSGFILLNFTGDPEVYIEGGSYKYHMADKNGIRDYEFKATKKSAYYEFYSDTYFYSARRKVSFDAMVNIILSPVDEVHTEVKVNAKYTLNLDIEGETMSGTPLPSFHETITFQTGEMAKSSMIYNDTYFFSNGRLELMLLNFAK